jgi:CO dehydrogenase nickel-insertion accessory protein CooC1
MKITQAQRKRAKIKLAIQGCSGSGKTFSSLLLAKGLTNQWSDICVIDTENHSADLYAHLGNYNVLTIGKPFNPESYIQAIELCEESVQVAFPHAYETNRLAISDEQSPS